MTELTIKTIEKSSDQGSVQHMTVKTKLGGRIALIDDDKNVTNTLSQWLSEAGYEVVVFNEPHRFIRSIGEFSAQLILLDWMMPGVKGPDLLSQLRDHFHLKCPVIFITGVDDTQSIAHGLDSGADDYMVKPLIKEILLARVRAVMRRNSAQTLPSSDGRLSEGPYQLNLRQHTLLMQGVPVHLTPKEFELAWLLFSNIDQFLPKREALARLWGKTDAVDTHTLAQHVYALKKKLKLADHGYCISVIYGSGYRLEKRYAS
jgi:two-component system, OmpR family, response regulator RegX3